MTGSSWGQIASAWAVRLRTIDSSAICFACGLRSLIARIAYSCRMRAAAGAACAVLISGCLIVRADEDVIEPPCPTTSPQLLAEASGPFVIADAIYFMGINGVLARVP